MPNIKKNNLTDKKDLKHEPNFGKIWYDEVDFETSLNSVDDSCREEE